MSFNWINHFLEEDDYKKNFFYEGQLPQNVVICSLKIKSNCLLTGIPFFLDVFKTLGATNLNENDLLFHEGKFYDADKNFEIKFELPFDIALTGERIALNLLQRSSSISTFTQKFVQIAEKYSIKILDTRKTTPGLRALEKYSVRMGGGFNHRFGPIDIFMIKDNHKNFFGGLENSWQFFKNLNSFYSPIIVEIHSLEELQKAIKLNIKNIMLDNFSQEDIKKAITLKRADMTYEISGGITLSNIENYCIQGIDAISIGSLTYAPPPVDLSLKMYPKE